MSFLRGGGMPERGELRELGIDSADLDAVGSVVGGRHRGQAGDARMAAAGGPRRRLSLFARSAIGSRSVATTLF